ncbi:MAG: TadE family protein [Pontixanthobacter sp.]
MRFPYKSNRLRADQSGVTAVEFGIVAPVLCLLLMGMFDIGFQGYAQSMLNGAMQDAGRRSSLEPTLITTQELDDDVRRMMLLIAPTAEFTFERRNYATFDDIGRPENFTDLNDNGECDDNEPFEDVNGNNTWDADQGRDGLGGARDAVIYTATAEYGRLFPLHGFIDGMDSQITLVGETVLRNQPYDEQATRAVVVGNCSA